MTSTASPSDLIRRGKEKHTVILGHHVQILQSDNKGMTVRCQGTDLYIPAKKTFANYVGDMTKFMQLPLIDRLKAFMRWKHGLSSFDANKSLDNTERSLLSGISDDDIASMTDGKRLYWRLEKAWQRYCNEVRQQIKV